MHKQLAWFGFCLLLVACGPAKKIPKGSPPTIKTKALLDSIQNHRLEFNSLMFTGTGHFKDAKQNQSFRFKIRMLKDSVIWVDITDPIIGGIKVARAVLYPDSIAFINTINKKYLTGNLSILQQNLSLDFGFSDMQNLLSSNQVFPLDKDHDLYYRPNKYVLANFPIHKKDSTGMPSQAFLSQSIINPELYRPGSQLRSLFSEGKSYRLDYEEYFNFGDFYYPKIIRLTVTDNSSQRLELEIKNANINQRLNIPFSIPNGYDKIP